MPLIYITGPSGAGKSTVRKELQKRDYEAHDTDEDGMSAWHNMETSEKVKRPDVPERPADWYEHHAYRMSPERVKALAERAKDKIIFLCGIPSNDLELAKYYDKVICLIIDEETMKQRIASRDTNTFGKSPDELKLMLYWHGKMLERYEKFGAVMIDATKPVSEVVDEILRKCIDFAQVGHESLDAFVQTIKKLAESGEPFDVIAAAGDSGQLAARITEEVYTLLGKPVPSKLVAPVYRHADEAETILFDNKVLAAQFASWKNKPLTNVLFVDDEIGGGNAARGMLDLLLALNPDIQSFAIVAEDGGFDCPPEIRGVKTRFIPTRTRIPGVYNAISYTVPWKFQEPLKTALADEPDLNDKQVMCTLLNQPAKEFNDGKPEFNDRLIEQAREALPNFPDLQKEYQEHFTTTIKGYL